MNRVIITGRLGRDPEMKVANSGTELINFTVAVDRRMTKGKDKITDWIPCTAFGKTAAFINQYFHKGDGIHIQGRLESSTSEAHGEKRTFWNVTVDEVEFPLGGKRSEPAQAEPSVVATLGTETAVETDEDLPF